MLLSNHCLAFVKQFICRKVIIHIQVHVNLVSLPGPQPSFLPLLRFISWDRTYRKANCSFKFTIRSSLFLAPHTQYAGCHPHIELQYGGVAQTYFANGNEVSFYLHSVVTFLTLNF